MEKVQCELECVRHYKMWVKVLNYGEEWQRRQVHSRQKAAQEQRAKLNIADGKEEEGGWLEL